MNKLLTLEQDFQNYLLDNNQDIFQHVLGTSKVPVDVRLNIYGYAYRSRLHEALMSSYEVLHSYLGDERFEALCYDYIDAHPSNFRSIRWFGDQFAPFIKDHPSYQEFPYLAELAQFEWTMTLVFDAADSEIIQLEDMHHIAPEAWINMRFKLHPSVHRLSLHWNAVQLWQAITDEQPVPDLEYNTPAIEWVLWRNEFMSQFSSLPPDEAWAIDAMRNNATFGELCEGVCQWVEEQHAGMHAASLLKGWIVARLIATVVVD